MLPVITNEEKYESLWRQAMQEPMPLYFNPDGTRTNAVIRSRDTSPQASFIEENPSLHQATVSLRQPASIVKVKAAPSMVSSLDELTMIDLNKPLAAVDDNIVQSNSILVEDHKSYQLP